MIPNLLFLKILKQDPLKNKTSHDPNNANPNYPIMFNLTSKSKI